MTNTVPGRRFRVLVIDDITAIHEDFRKILAPTAAPSNALRDSAAALFGTPVASAAIAEFSVDCAHQGEEGLGLVERAIADGRRYALAFVDVRMPPGWDGLETIKRLWAVDPALQIVLCTAYSDYSWTETIRKLGVTASLIILKKPVDNTEVLQLAHAMTCKWQLAEENAQRLSTLNDLVRQRTEEVRRAEDKFTQAFTANPHAQALIAVDQPEILAVNQAFEQQFGLTQAEVAGAKPESFGRSMDRELWAALIGRLAAGESFNGYEFVFQPNPAIRRDVRCAARPIRIGGRACSIWVLEDITMRLQLESQLRQSQKLEAVGQLAAGVAHDFNNLLTVIQCYTEKLLAADANAHLRDHLEPVLASAILAGTLTRKLLVFSRKQITRFENLDPAGILRNLQPLLDRLIGEQISLQWEISPDLPALHADAAAIEQIVINLVVNARDAVQAGGRVTIRALHRVFQDAKETNHAEGRAGSFLVLEVVDNGKGISPEAMPHIFEPFFSTKEVGRGTGLGLSTVRSLVQQHQGWIDLETTVGEGTIFGIFLPALTKSPSIQNRALLRKPSRDLPKIRLLVVEDDCEINRLFSLIFTDQNVQYTIVTDGHGALDAWHYDGPYDALVSDVVLPNGISGIDLARQLRAQQPALPIVFVTGYGSGLLAAKQHRLPGPAPQVVPKPFGIESLIDAINDAISDPANYLLGHETTVPHGEAKPWR